MAPKYKLTYFDLKGLGEQIRCLLSYMEEDFEDRRIKFEEWSDIKSTMPFGKLPVLEENGKPLTQSISISRYLGKKAGLAGNDDWENVQIDIIADTINDLRLGASGAMWEENEEAKRVKKETYIKETLPTYLKKLEEIAKENGGYLANKKLSWVDFMFTCISDYLSFAADSPDALADYPNLKAVREKVSSLPQIKKWLAKRPKNDF